MTHVIIAYNSVIIVSGFADVGRPLRSSSVVHAVSAVPEKAGAKTVSDLSRTGRAGPGPGRAGSVSNAAAASPMVGGVLRLTSSLTRRPARAANFCTERFCGASSGDKTTDSCWQDVR